MLTETRTRIVLRVLPPTDVGAVCPVPRLWDDGKPDTRRPHWWLMGDHHHGSLKTGKPLHDFTDPTRPPTESELIARFGPDFRPCKCKRCRGAVLIFAWWGGQAAEILTRQLS